MKVAVLFILLFVSTFQSVSACKYVLDFGLMTDFEDMRPLVDLCTDFGALERYRGTLESAGDLESLREALEGLAVGRFSGCPDDVTGTGIQQIRE